jgi:cytochrome d ubiquinol oxidase subunit II
MLLLVALIFRAVSLEFRSKEPARRWRQFWDISFSVGSIVVALLFGVAIGNAVIGFELGPDHTYQGSFLDLLTPYALAAGVFNLGMFAMHGSIYLLIKTEGDLQEQVRGWAWRTYGIFLTLFAGLTAFTLWKRPEMIANFSFGAIQAPGRAHPFITDHSTLISVVAWVIVLLTTLAIANIPRMLHKRHYMGAFVSSALMMAAVIGLFALGLFPNLMVSSTNIEYSLDIYNAASSDYTLKTMFILAAIGMPFVIAYTSLIYWTYRGKTTLTDESY